MMRPESQLSPLPALSLIRRAPARCCQNLCRRAFRNSFSICSTTALLRLLLWQFLLSRSKGDSYAAHLLNLRDNPHVEVRPRYDVDAINQHDGWKRPFLRHGYQSYRFLDDGKGDTRGDNKTKKQLPASNETEVVQEQANSENAEKGGEDRPETKQQDLHYEMGTTAPYETGGGNDDVYETMGNNNTNDDNQKISVPLMEVVGSGGHGDKKIEAQHEDVKQQKTEEDIEENDLYKTTLPITSQPVMESSEKEEVQPEPHAEKEKVFMANTDSFEQEEQVLETVTEAPSEKPKQGLTEKPTDAPYRPGDDDPIKEEDEIFVEHEEVQDLEQELHQEEKVARRAGGFGIFIGIVAMIFTAHQMSENPDGIYASVCRLAITICTVVIKIVCMPCRKLLGAGNPHYHGHMPISTSDYSYRNDPYRSTANAGFELS